MPVTRVGRAGAVGSVNLSPAFPLWLRRAEADVFVHHEPNPWALVSHLAARPKGKLVVWFHSEVVRPEWRYRLFYRPFLRPVLDRAERIVVAAPPLAERSRQLGDHRDKCGVIPFGLDTTRFEPTPEVLRKVEAARARFGESFVLAVGRLVPYKGLDVLLEALRGTSLRAVIAGAGPLRAELEANARKVGVDGQVVFAGNVPEADLVALYHACRAFVMPSVTRAEAFGVVQLEAMACGKPVVSTNLPTGVPWVNRHGETGLVVEPRDAAGLREALVHLVENPGVAERLGAQGRARVATEFTIAGMIAKTVALYAEVAGVAIPA